MGTDTRPELRLVRANGGFKIHLMPEGKYTSLCGHTPQNNNFKMTSRGKWLRAYAGATASCKQCIKEAQKRGYEDYRDGPQAD